ncbi:MAG: hypothetical protein K2X69_15270, partial [Silvanigrellaceae bacterium]|nr:hypothetical protein [Silvanigrellaceae bacterium]
GAFNYAQEDYGQYILYGMPQGEFTSNDLIKEIDEEIVKLQTDLIAEKDFQKLQNINESNYIDSNDNIEGVAENLATYYLLYGDVNLVNTNIDILRSITREEIRDAAIEMHERLNGTWVEQSNDEMLQKKFWEIYPVDATDENGIRLHGNILSRYSTLFLRNNQDWLER